MIITKGLGGGITKGLGDWLTKELRIIIKHVRAYIVASTGVRGRYD